MSKRIVGGRMGKGHSTEADAPVLSSRIAFSCVCLVFAAFLLIPDTVRAATYYADAAGGDDAYDGTAATWDGVHGPKATIQAAIGLASTGDTVVAAPGTYAGTVNFGGRNITVRSQAPTDPDVVAATVINGGGDPAGDPAVAVVFNTGETAAAVLDGFTVTTDSGRGISCSSASPTIAHCIVTGNSSYSGGGFYLYQSNAAIRGCLIACNFTGMDGAGAIYSEGGTVSVEGCTVVDNGCGMGGAFAGGLGVASGSVSVRNCIVRGNTFDGMPEQGYTGANATLTVDYSSVQDGQNGIYGNVTWGTGIISSDPVFADASNGDYHLKSTYGRWDGSQWVQDAVASPCIDVGDPASDWSIEPAGNGGRVNLGAFGNTLHASLSGPSGPQFVTAPASLSVPEGGTAGLSISLSQAPAADVVASVFLGAGSDPDLSLLPPLTLTFTTTTWADLQTVTVSAAEDNADADAGTGTVLITATGLSDASVAVAEIDNELTLTVEADAGGSVTPAGTTVRTPGDVVPITATPEAEAQFSSWTGDTAGVADPAAAQTTVTVNTDTSLTATFTLPFLTYYVDAAAGSDTYDGFAQTWDGIHGPKQTIQAAIDAAYDDAVNSGELIVVSPGTYTECIDFRGLDITVSGLDPDSWTTVASTVISAEWPATAAVVFDDGEDADAVLTGVKIAVNGGRAVYCENSSPVIRANIVEAATDEMNPGALTVNGGAPLIEGNIVRNCSGMSCPGVYFYGGAAGEIRGNLIHGNTSWMDGACAVTLSGASPLVTGNTIADNTGGDMGGASAAIHCYNSSPVIRNCILRGNSSEMGMDLRQVSCSGSSAPSVSYSCVEGGQAGVSPEVTWGTGNIDSDPLFADSANSDYHLKSEQGRRDGSQWVQDTVSSPCIDAGDPADDVSAEPAPNGGRINMGYCGGTASASMSVPDTPQFVLTPPAVDVPEGGTAVFTVTLAQQPAADVSVTVSVVSGDSDITVSSGGSFILGPADWDTGASVQLSAAEDNTDADNGTAVLEITAAGIDDAALTATEIDNDFVLTVTGGTPAGPTVCTAAAVVTVTAAPAAHFHFTEWTGDTAGVADVNAAETTVTVTADTALTAASVLDQHTVDVTAGNGAASGGGVYDYGSVVQLQVTPDAGCHFVNWIGNVPAGQETANPLTLTVDGDLSVHAVCAADSYIFSAASLSIAEGGSGSVSVALGAQPAETLSVSVLAVSVVNAAFTVDTPVPLLFTPADWDQPQILQVSAVEDADAVDGTARLEFHCDALGSDSVALSEEDNDVTLTLTAGAGGVVTPSGLVVVTAGSSIAVAAVPDAEYAFDHWEGDTACLDDPDAAAATATPLEDGALEAVFRPLNRTFYADPVSGSPAFDGLSPVWDGVHGPKQTLQSAVDAAADGDTVAAAPGIYTETLDFGGRDVTVRSETPDDPACVLATVIDPGDPYGWEPAVTASTSETTAARLEGFHIRNVPTGIHIENSALTIRNCRFSGIRSECGAAVYVTAGQADIDGLVLVGTASPDCLGTGICAVNGSSVTVRHALVAGNNISAAAVSCHDSDITMDFCTIAFNEPGDTFEFVLGGHALRLTGGSTASISNSILFHNDGGYGRQIELTDSTLTVSYTDLEGGLNLIRSENSVVNWGLGMIDADPRFADPAAGDFHPCSMYGRRDAAQELWVTDSLHSPCIDGGDPASPLGQETSPHGARVNMGAFGGTAEAGRGVYGSDHDGDRLSGYFEYTSVLTDPRSADTDSDGLDDGWEWIHGTDPLADDAGEDPDEDGVTNAQEHALGTLPREADSDGDGMPDGWEYAAGLNPASGWYPDLLAYWNCNARSGAWLRDLRANRPEDGIIRGQTAGFDGTLAGGAVCMDEDGASVLLLDGVSQWVEVPGGATFDLTGEFTVSMDVRFDAFGDPTAPIGLFWKGTDALPVECSLTYTPSESLLRYSHCNSAGETDQADFTVVLPAQQWRQITVTVASSGCTLYVDGVFTGTAAGPVHAREAGEVIRIGAADTLSVPMKGALDNVRVYTSAVSQARAAELCDALGDADGDGIAAADEYRMGLDPAVNDSVTDSDGDGLTNADEVLVYGTDPALADHDGDGVSDGDEVAAGTDATVADQGSDAGGPVVAVTSPAVNAAIGF